MSDRNARKHRTVWVVGIACALGGFATGAIAAAKKPSTIVSAQDAKWVPMDPNMPAGPQIAVLSGDPKKGKSEILLKLKKGSAPLHVHSADYRAVLVQGSTKHWDEGQTEAEAKALNPGSYWAQPGKAVHGDACLTDECIIYVTWAGKLDFKLAEEPKK
jgi:hypothetical protein